MNRKSTFAGCCLLATIAVAQQPKPSPAPADAQARMESLENHYQELLADWRRTVAAAQEAARDPANRGKTLPAIPMRPDVGPLVAEVQAAAREFAGTKDAPQFLLWIVNRVGPSDKKATGAALTTLAADHLDSEEIGALGRLVPRLPQILDDRQAGVLRDRLRRSRNPDLQGWVEFAELNAVIEQEPHDSDRYVQARAKLLADAARASDSELVRAIQGAIDLREKFSTGGIAPDIAGVDLDGVAFKLSDYQGKVVFLDFWGDW